MGSRGSTSNIKTELAKQIAKKLGYGQADYKQFLRPTYIEGYGKTEGKEYSVAELKRRLKNI